MSASSLSLQARLLIAVGGLALAAIGLVALAARHETRLEFLRFAAVQRHEASMRLPDLAPRLARALDRRCCEAGLATVATELPPNAALLVLDASGALVAAGGTAAVDGTHVAVRRERDALTLEVSRRAGGRLAQAVLVFRQAPTPLRLADGRSASLYVVPLPADHDERPEAAFFGALDRRLLLAAAIVGALALIATWLIVRGVTRPVEALQAATRDVAAGAFTRRVEPRGSRETIALGEAFNAMAAELQRQEALRRDLVHDVAHELRTPLTDLRCRLEAVIDGLAADPQRAVRDLLDDVRHLGRLVDDLQEVAQAEARTLPLDVRPVALTGAIQAALRTAGLDGDARLAPLPPLDLVVRADPDRVRQILVNLLTNAARYTPAGGAIAIDAAVIDDAVRVQVRNTGSALDAAAIGRVFDRFYRADPARSRATGGSGLGLAIVKQLVEAQGGTVWAASDASGVTVGFALPKAD
jgi:two-component system, OmpR family, sensor histidine kinase BaeS